MQNHRHAHLMPLSERQIANILVLASLLFLFSCQKGTINPVQENASVAAEKGILFSSNFESDVNYPSSNVWLQQEPVAGDIKISNERSHSGVQSTKFTFNYKDWDGNSIVDGRRTEISFKANAPCQKYALGKTYWVAFSSFIPNDWIDDYENNTELIWQFHGSDNGPGDLSPCLAAYVKGGNLNIHVRTNAAIDGALHLLASIPVPKGDWGEWIIQANFDYNNGFIKVWHNDSLLVDYNGSTIYHTTGQTNENGPFLKLGIYKYQWRNLPTKVQQRVIYYDDVIVGDSTTTYAVISTKLKNNGNF